MTRLYIPYLSFLLVLALSTTLTLGQNANYIASEPNSTTPGSANTFVGPAAGLNTQTGAENTFVGANAGRNLTSGGNNTVVGSFAGIGMQTASANTFVGYGAGALNRTGNRNAFIGAGAGRLNDEGYNNIFIGYEAGRFNRQGRRNVYAGFLAGFNGDTDDNVFVGDSSGYNNKASANLFIGSKAGLSNQTGVQNTFLGYHSGYNAISDSNTFVGYQSGYATTTGRGNTFFGAASGRGNTTGNHNTFVGNGAGPSGSNSDDNVYIGHNTGRHDSGSRNTILGTGADVLAQNLTNATAIGAGAGVAVSNALVLGHNANVGIGTSAPTTRLEVNSGISHESGLRLTQLLSESPVALVTADKVLTVDATGRVILTQAGRYSVRSVTDWSDNVFTPGYRLAPLKEVERYITAHQHLPGIPSAEEVVKEGVDVGKMEAKLLQKVEELTLYSIELEKVNKQQQADINDLKQLVKQLLEKK
ncbi:hypothetical protein ACFSUS_16935 [Spirosoma soli]|uniref:TMF family protein n=1 Tax=Spirosoma soli TaxID=1770529 RepID=A0ABW5M6M2_9BACT